jgi:hypothetical protein
MRAQDVREPAVETTADFGLLAQLMMVVLAGLFEQQHVAVARKVGSMAPLH